MTDLSILVADADAKLEATLLLAAETILGMSADERPRWDAGRSDWRDGDWQDHCGVPDCAECRDNLIPDGDAMVAGQRQSLVDRLKRDGAFTRASRKEVR